MKKKKTFILNMIYSSDKLTAAFIDAVYQNEVMQKTESGLLSV